MEELETKTCAKCQQTKPIDDYYWKDNQRHHSRCKACLSVVGKERYKTQPRKPRTNADRKRERERRASWTPEQRERVLAKKRSDYYKHQKERQAEHRRWLAKPDKYERSLQRAREYKREHRVEIAAQRRQKHASDPVRRISTVLRHRIQMGIKADYALKTTTSEKLIGCTWTALRSYIESLWEQDMSWKNYGYWGWHLDHIKPVGSFDLIDVQQQYACFHWSNLRPLWREDHLNKTRKDFQLMKTRL